MFEAQIKNALKSAGLDEGLWTQIKVEKEEQIENAVVDFMAARNLQSEVDKRVTQALKTQEAKLKKEYEEKLEAELKKVTEKNTQKDEGKKDQDTMTPEQKEIQSLKETNKIIMEKLDGLTTKISASDKSTIIRAELKKQGLSEKFESNIVVDDPGKIAEAVSGFKANFDEQQQVIINEKLSKGELAPVKMGTAGQTLEENKVADYAKSIGKGGAPKNPDFIGKISSPEPVAQAAAT